MVWLMVTMMIQLAADRPAGVATCPVRATVTSAFARGAQLDVRLRLENTGTFAVSFDRSRLLDALKRGTRVTRTSKTALIPGAIQPRDGTVTIASGDSRSLAYSVDTMSPLQAGDRVGVFTVAFAGTAKTAGEAVCLHASAIPITSGHSPVR